ATRLISGVRKELDVNIEINEIFTNSTIRSLANIIKTKSEQPKSPLIKCQERPLKIPLSFAQERIWFINKLHDNGAYNIPAVLKLKGELDINFLEASFQEIINRHEILRTVYKEDNGLPYQELLERNNWQLEIIDDCICLDEKDLDKFLYKEDNKGFDLSNDHMIRIKLLKRTETEFILIVKIHHIASDGWSMPILVNELIELYKSKKERKSPLLVELPIQYSDYAIWQREYLSNERLTDKLKYWEKQLNEVSSLNLPIDFKRSKTQKFNGDVFSLELEKALSDKLDKLSKKFGVTLFMTLLAAFKILLNRYSGEHDICVGSPIANRTQTETESLIGFFVNTIVLRSDLTGNPSFKELLLKVKHTTLEAYINQEVPFEKIVDRIQPSRDTSRTPFFQVMFALQNNEIIPDLELEGVEVSNLTFNQKIAKYDLTVNIMHIEDTLNCSIEYCSDLFKKVTIERIMEQYVILLSSICSDPTKKIDELELLTSTERLKVSEEFNPQRVSQIKNQTIANLFEEQVHKTPNKMALSFKGKSLTYQELDNYSNQFARLLVDKGINPLDKVGILSCRGFEMIISILGILKCGAIYVPLNEEYPLKRLQYILKDSNVVYIAYHGEELLRKHDLSGCKFVKIKELFNYPKTQINNSVTSEDGAYVMYTSGTTGEPKGILVSHRNVHKLVKEKGAIRLFPEDRVLQWSNFSFDGSVYEIFSTLLNGASLFLISENEAFDPNKLTPIISKNKITVAFLTTVLFNALVEHDLKSLITMRRLLFGGEQVSVPHVKKALEILGPKKMIHVYGPTEATVFSTYYPINSCDNNKVPIGKPLDNTNIYILNSSKKLCGLGMVGEIYIGGDNISKGYLNNELLNEKLFLSNSLFSNSKIYKTGDIARWLPDGNIDFIGRLDDQIKIRGYRIELSEIEMVIREFSSIIQTVVLAKSDIKTGKFLVAYLVSKEGFNKEVFQDYLQMNLPEYMVPKFIIELSEIPLTTNGKLNKKALPSPDFSKLSTNNYLAPRNQVEKNLVDIWGKVLHIENIGVYDNFFELGGHSLLATRVVSMIKQEMDIEIDIKTFFEYPNIESIAKHISVRKENVLNESTNYDQIEL
uniref:non-ribosomal peptide synthetase n=1 Tax=Aquimarina sp. I32.4 TaxID=2053903 RepID=UPI0011AF55C5